ncbi:MAG: ATP-binding protein [Bacteriovoracia bacterium]
MNYLDLENESYSKSEVSELLAKISHEVRNSLSSVKLTAAALKETIEQEGHSKKAGLLTQNLERAVSHFENVCNSILRTTKSSPEAPKTITSQEVIETVSTLVQPILKKQNIRFEVLESPIVTLLCNKTRIYQSLVNLILNAKDAALASKNPWIALAVSTDETHVHFSVLDSGAGIPDSQIDKVSEPFYTTKQNTGTGIGLAIVKSIAKEHGGFLKYDRDLGYTRFTLSISRDKPQESKKTHEEESKNTETQSRKPILLIEDNEEVSVVFSMLLEQLDPSISVKCAFSGKEALEKIVHIQPEIILMDLGLPDIPGETLAKIIKRVLPATRIIGLSGKELNNDIPEFETFFLKPVSPSVIVNQIFRKQESVPYLRLVKSIPETRYFG